MGSVCAKKAFRGVRQVFLMWLAALRFRHGRMADSAAPQTPEVDGSDLLDCPDRQCGVAARARPMPRPQGRSRAKYPCGKAVEPAKKPSAGQRSRAGLCSLSRSAPTHHRPAAQPAVSNPQQGQIATLLDGLDSRTQCGSLANLSKNVLGGPIDSWSEIRIKFVSTLTQLFGEKSASNNQRIVDRPLGQGNAVADHWTP